MAVRRPYYALLNQKAAHIEVSTRINEATKIGRTNATMHHI